MAHTDHHGPASGEPVGHETSDASLGGVEKFIVVMTVLLAASFLLMWLLYGHFRSRETARDVMPSPMVAREGDRLPPQPRLQMLPPTGTSDFDSPPQDLQRLRTVEENILTTWTWSDAEHAFAQIPVDRAIELLAERGIQPPPAPAEPAPAAK